MIVFIVALAQDCEYEVSNCSSESTFINGELRYVFSGSVATNNSILKMCPRSDDDVPQWRVSTQLNSTDVPGIFCSNTTFNSSNVCNDKGILVIKQKQFSGRSGIYNFNFVSNNTNVKYELQIRFGLTGVHPFNGSVVRVNEGAEMAKLSWIIYPSSSLDAVQLFRGEVMSNLAVFDDSSECMQPMTSEFPTVLSVSVSSPNESSQGEYTLIVSGLSSGQNTSNISLRIDPVSPLPSSTISITSTITISITSTTNSVSDTPTDTPASASPSIVSPSSTTNDSITATVVIIAASCVLFIACVVFVIIVIILGCVCHKRRQNPLSAKRGDPEGIEIMPLSNGTSNQNTSKPRLGSTSSERPLTQGGSTSAINTPTSDSPLNYTAVYCSEQYSQCGKIIKEKHSDLIHIVDGEDAIRNSLVDPYCTDILLITLSIDEVVREIMSCGIDPQRPNGREKLRFVKFVSKDQYPDKTIGVNGFKYVLVEGDPSNIDTLLQAINKAEYPELVKDYRTEDHYGKGEDHFDLPEPQAQSTPHSLPRDLVIDGHTGRQLLEQQKKTNRLLEDISNKTGQNVEVNRGIKRATETIVENTQEQVALGRENIAVLETVYVEEDSSTNV